MEAEQLYANGNPVCPRTNYENDNAAQRINRAEALINEIAERVATRLLLDGKLRETQTAD